MACHERYGSNSVLAIKINNALTININRSSSVDKRRHRRPSRSFRILQIKKTFHFKISWLATLQFKELLKKKKQEKTFTWQRGNSKQKGRLKKKKMEDKWRGRWKLYKNLKLGDYKLIKLKKLSYFTMLWLLRYMSFLALALDNSDVFTGRYLEYYYEKGQNK